jgi:hypothetical protein
MVIEGNTSGCSREFARLHLRRVRPDPDTRHLAIEKFKVEVQETQNLEITDVGIRRLVFV